MKIAILSDIHANFDAFNAILQDDSFLECDVYVNAGDSIGYFNDPLQVVSSLISYDFLSVRGNHEDMLIKASENDAFLKSITESYGSGHEIALHQLENDHFRYLRSLPDFQKIESSEGNVFVYHGSPSKNTDYFYPDFSENVNTLEIPKGCLWLILGNTHWPMLRHVNGTIIINPGSVGQPRNGIEGAHWAILNTANGDVTFKIKAYK